MKKKSKNKFLFNLFILIILGIGVYYVYQEFFANQILLKDKNYTFIYIKHNDNIDQVINEINAQNIIKNLNNFKWLAKSMGLEKNIYPGKYRIINGMTMRQIINLIKYNKEEKVKLNFNYQIHNLEEFISYVDEKLELNSTELSELLNDKEILYKSFQLEPKNAFSIVIPNSENVSWAISKEELFKILENNYHKIWDAKRISLAKKTGFSIPEIITLASIVQSESRIKSEQEKIAGVYINRLKKDMLLQADPTLKFANKNFNVKRILNNDKEINSPYNTYKYKGLPPGPICLVSQQAIDATLNFNNHDFIFFCAKPELNGLSDYSSNYQQHKRFADAYHKALDKKGINR